MRSPARRSIQRRRPFEFRWDAPNRSRFRRALCGMLALLFVIGQLRYTVAVCPSPAETPRQSVPAGAAAEPTAVGQQKQATASWSSVLSSLFAANYRSAGQSRSVGCRCCATSKNCCGCCCSKKASGSSCCSPRAVQARSSCCAARSQGQQTAGQESADSANEAACWVGCPCGSRGAPSLLITGDPKLLNRPLLFGSRSHCLSRVPFANESCSGRTIAPETPPPRC